MNPKITRMFLSQALGKTHQGERDIYEVCGYPKTLTFGKHYKPRYDRGSIGSRVVNAPANATWKHTPELVEDNDKDSETDFEEDWKNLVDNDDLNVINNLKRADRLAGIGRFGILVLGFADGKDLNQPVEANELDDIEDLLYLSPYHEGSVDIKEWDLDPKSKRFGKPKIYTVDMTSNIEGIENQLREEDRKQDIHYTRVVHLAENLEEDEVFGTPRMKKVFNQLIDIEKITGGSAEMFWKNADRGIQADVKDEYELSPDEEEALQEQFDEYIHGLRRVLQTRGVDINSLGSDVANPKSHFEILISLVSAQTNIPQRILLGSERGELASSQDQSEWYGTITERRENYAEKVIKQLVKRLTHAGVMNPPQDRYKAEWPELFELNGVEKSQVAKNYATAVKNLAPEGATELLVTMQEARKMLGLEAEPKEPLEEEEPLDEEDTQVQQQFNKLMEG